MVLIICTKNELNLTNRYWDMVPDRQKVWMDGWTDRMDGRTDDAKTISLRLRWGITNTVVIKRVDCILHSTVTILHSKCYYFTLKMLLFYSQNVTIFTLKCYYFTLKMILIWAYVNRKALPFQYWDYVVHPLTVFLSCSLTYTDPKNMNTFHMYIFCLKWLSFNILLINDRHVLSKMLMYWVTYCTR